MECEGLNGVFSSCPPIGTPGTTPYLTDPQSDAILQAAIIFFCLFLFMVAMLIGWIAVSLTES